MEDSQAKHVSARRLRLGVFFVFLWWLQIPTLIVLLAPLFHISDTSKTIVVVTIITMVIQSILGLLGVLLAGKEVAKVIKHAKFRETPKLVWKILRHGSYQL